MATILTDNFNGYNDGNLGGQGSWQAVYGNLKVQGTLVKEGAKAIKNGTAYANNRNTKQGTAQTTGKTTFYALVKDHSSWDSNSEFQFACRYGYTGDPSIWVQFHRDGNIKLYDGGSSSWLTVQAYSDDQWYCVEIEWRSSPDYKYRVRIDGGTWTGWYAGSGGNWTSGLNYIHIACYCNLVDKQFLDSIAEEPLGAIHEASVTLSGAGTLAAAGKVTRRGSTTLSGAGTLAAAGKVTRRAKATLSGQGTLAAIARATRTGKATLSGTGALAAAAHVTITAKATLSGTGTLAAAAGATRTAKATLSGTGTLAAAALVTRRGSATLSGEGTLAAAAHTTRAAKATLSGEGLLAAAGKVTRRGAATMSGTGALAATAHITRRGTATMAGTGSLAAAAHVTRTAAATLSGEGYLAAAGTVITAALSGSATLSGTGTLSARAVAITVAKATLSGQGTLTASGLLTRTAKATLSGEGSLAAAGKVTRTGRATLSGEGTLAAAGVYIAIARATLSGTGTLAAAAVVIPAGLTATLLAAQKALHRIPYVEAKVYDYEQGIKRLSWTRLYTGSEPDNHHGIAFDGEGSMHRIRAAASDKLYYQKVASPGPTSDYTQWTEVAADCAGPCAIAAYGTKVYIFYKKTDDTLRKYYSHNYGQDWTAAELAAYTGALSLAAAWKGTTDTVVCFVATIAKISALVLDTSDQTTAEHYLNHGLDTTYGIGATYQDGEFPIVLAGRDTEGDIVTYALYRTKLSDIYSFSALRILISAHDDVATAFKYPDCHLPAEALSEGGQVYETIQLTVVEDYSGVTAYTRPLLAHLVKDTSWSDATVTEPKPFVNLSSPYGLRMISDSSYWWLSTPSGVWRAPRPAESPLNLTPYIQQLHQAIADRKPGSLIITLDNSKGQFASPGEGALASLTFRAEVQLRLGYKTTAGNEALDSLTYWVDSWEYSTNLNQSLFCLRCVDLWGLAAAWSARYSLRWNYTTWGPCRVWEILYQLLGRLGVRLWNNPAAPKSSTIDNYYPMFLSRGGTAGETQLRRLLSFVTDALVPRRALCFAKNLLPAEASSYSYGAGAAAHRILAGAYASRLTTTHTQVSGDTQDEPPVHVREAAFDWDLLSLGIDNLRMQYDANLEETDQAAKRADALLRGESLRAERGNLVVPTNVAQELYDVITVTDKRCGIDQEKYRVLAIQTDYDRRKGVYTQRLALGAP